MNGNHLTQNQLDTITANEVAAKFPAYFRKGNHHWPPDFSLAETIRQYAAEHGIKDAEQVFEAFVARPQSTRQMLYRHAGPLLHSYFLE
jgi:hypothetical protein